MVTCEIKQLNEEQEAREIFRNMKIDYDKARLQLIEYRLEDVIADYHKLRELREDIQQKFFSVIELICENELDDVDINTHEWQKMRDNENTYWDAESNILADYKYEVNQCLELLNDGTIEKMLIDEENTW